MKTVLLAFLFLISAHAFSQNDSTKIKLQQYKDLFDQGLINETEYAKLKNEAQVTPKKENSFNNTSSLPPDRTALAQVTGGTIFEVGGIATMIAGGLYRRNRYPDILINGKINENFKAQYYTYRKLYLTMFSFGAAMSGLGIVLEGLGISNYVKLNRKNTASLGLSNEGLGLALKF